MSPTQDWVFIPTLPLSIIYSWLSAEAAAVLAGEGSWRRDAHEPSYRLGVRSRRLTAESVVFGASDHKVPAAILFLPLPVTWRAVLCIFLAN